MSIAVEKKKKKLIILCLHGGHQSGEIMKQKIAGSRKKLERTYDLHFLDAPYEIMRTTTAEPLSPPSSTISSQSPSPSPSQLQPQRQLEWWSKQDEDCLAIDDNNDNKNINNNRSTDNRLQASIEYVLEETKDTQYDAIIGFSQGGLLATAMLVRGGFPSVRALVTAGAPYRKAPFEVCVSGLLPVLPQHNHKHDDNHNDNDNHQDIIDTDTPPAASTATNNTIPKLHFSGSTDTMVSTESTTRLCDHGGNGRVSVHTKGHLFPTQARYTNEMIEFLTSSLSVL